MNSNQNPSEHSIEFQVPQKRSFWRKLGGGSLSVSLVLHVILVMAGLIWVFQVIPANEERVVGVPQSGTRGSPSSESQAEKQRVRMAQPDLSRIVSADAPNPIALPEPEKIEKMAAMGSITRNELSNGTGGGGGSRKGGNIGPGVGDGIVPSMSNDVGKNPFGALEMDRGALEGTFYDLKQTRHGKPTGMTDTQMREELMEITRRGFRDSTFDKYFKAPRQLYQTKLFVPVMPADGAPAAFEVEKEVQPRMWVVVYRGAVRAPKTGRFRFVGQCDDFLVIRFNDKPMFDYGYTMAGTGTHVNGRANDFNGTNDVPELAKNVRRLTPMKLPITFYQYASTPGHNRNIGGLAVGPEFSVEAGKTYPIDIMIGEIPGGFFSMNLLIEEIGATYEKDPAGFPILPIFSLDHSQPAAGLKGEDPPYAPNGPVWQYVAGGNSKDIR